MNKINGEIANTTFDAILIQETWFHEGVTDASIIANTNFNLIRSDRSNFLGTKRRDGNVIKGGGVLSLISENFECEGIESFDATILEHNMFRLILGGSEFIIMNVYMNPNRARKTQVNEFAKLVRMIQVEYKIAHIIACGDFNMSGVRWSFGEETESSSSISHEEYFVSECNKLKLCQVNKFANSRGAYLDLVLTTCPDRVQVTEPDGHLQLDKSSVSHNPYVVMVTYSELNNALETKKITRKIIKLKKSKELLENSKLNVYTSDDLLRCVVEYDETNAINNTLCHKLIKIQQQCSRSVKCVEQKGDQSTHPWTRNRQYKTAVRLRKLAKDNYARNQSELNKLKLRMAHVYAYNIYNDLKNVYYSRLIDKCNSDARLLYQLMKTKRNAKGELPAIMFEHQIKRVGHERISALHKHLNACFFDSYTPFPVDQSECNILLGDIYRDTYDTRSIHLWRTYINWFTEEEVREAINHINEKKDPGPMGIDASFVKFNSGTLLTVFTNLFNMVMISGAIPQSWKRSFITPIPKKGDTKEVSNYRGIAQQSVIAKIFDHLLTSKLRKHLSQVIPESQHGFMPCKSTITNLMEMNVSIFDAFDNGEQLDVVYFDFSKAFDRVDHSILAVKLAKLSMPFTLYLIVMNFVINRIYSMKIDGIEYTETIRTESAVPQGSICGPFLFLLMIHDLNKELADVDVNILQYADDLKIFRTIKNREEEQIMQSAIDRIVCWADVNRLELNQGKTYHVCFHKHARPEYKTRMYLLATRIQRKKEVCDLGLTFDERNKFRVHIRNIATRASQIYGASYHFAKEVGSFDVLKRVHGTYINPIIEYASPVWYQDQKREEKVLEATQRKFTRSCLKVPFDTRDERYITYEERCKTLGILTAQQRRILATILFAEKICQGLVKSKLQSQFLQCRNKSGRTTRSRHRFNLPKKKSRKHPLIIAMELINSYVTIYDEGDSIATIKNKIKNYFIETN